MNNLPVNETTPLQRKRALQLFICAIVVTLLLVARLFYLQIVRHDFFVNESIKQRSDKIPLSSDRGDIFDRNGNVIATSINSFSVGVHPSLLKDKNKVINALSRTLKIDRASLAEKLNSRKKFIWIKRKIEEPLARKVLDQKLEGVALIPEKKRVYPKNKLASHIIGFVGTDDTGLAGIEHEYDKYLRGEPGMLITEFDPHGREILTSHIRVLTPESDGMNITLTIDEPIQYRTEAEIKKAVKGFNARSGCAIVMDIKTGEILALAAYPDFDPNEYQKYGEDVWNNSVVKDVYEPGSTFKLVTVASGIEDGVITKNSRVDCPDTLELGGRVIKNSHTTKFNTKSLTVDEILRESVNTGAANIAIKMGKDKFYANIKKFGFGEKTDVGLPGESPGIVKRPSLWDKPDIGMMAFGQTIAVTPIQLITGLSALANKGIRVRPQLIKQIASVDSSFVRNFSPEQNGQAVSAKTAGDVLALSGSVVENGTGRLAKIPGFRVGGKTGTAQKPRPGGLGYIPKYYIGSFIGFVPLDEPRIAVLVVVDGPKPVYWGELVAAPAFKEIAEFSLRRLNIAPDKSAKSVI